MAGQMQRGGGQMMSEINITPFVDVMLVLLIIFMVAAPLLEKDEDEKRKVDLDLPVTTQNANRIDPEQTEKMILVVSRQLEVKLRHASVDGQDEVLLDCSDKLTQTEKDRFESCFDVIEQKLGKNPKLQEDKELYLLADTEIPYGFVVGVMARIKTAGVNKLGMVTNPEYLDEPAPKARPPKKKKK